MSNLEDESSGLETNPFRLTRQERESLDPNYKKPKKKGRKAILRSSSSDTGRDGHDQSRLYYAHTTSTRLKRRALENVYDVHSDLESVGGEGSLDDFDDEVLDDLEPDRHVSGGGSSSGGGAGEGGDAGGGEGKDDATFELANVRRYIIGEEPLSQIVANSRKMFLLKYSLSVKRDEKQRLENELREEEMAVQKTESELRLAEQAFDQFLQENDRKAVGAMKSAELETRLRIEKATALKQVDNRIIALKRDINKQKDILAEYGTYQGFLHSLSPDAWKQQQLAMQQHAGSDLDSLGGSTEVTGSTGGGGSEDKTAPKTAELEAPAPTTRRPMGKWKMQRKDSVVSGMSATTVSASGSVGAGQEPSQDTSSDRRVRFEERSGLARIMVDLLGMAPEEFEKAKGDVRLFFQHPHQLLSIFTDLEDENLKFIQECREEEGNLEKIRTSIRETRSRINQQARNFEMEIQKVEEQIKREKAGELQLLLLQMEKANEEEQAAEAKKAEDKILKELGKLVRNTYVKCVGPLEQEVTTMDLLKRIELRMETLTQQLERLPAEKVKIAQRTCERERRQREHEARMERQRQFEAERNQKALDRALAPPFVKPCLAALNPQSDSIMTERERMEERRRRRMGGGGGDDNQSGSEGSSV